MLAIVYASSSKSYKLCQPYRIRRENKINGYGRNNINCTIHIYVHTYGHTTSASQLWPVGLILIPFSSCICPGQKILISLLLKTKIIRQDWNQIPCKIRFSVMYTLYLLRTLNLSSVFVIKSIFISQQLGLPLKTYKFLNFREYDFFFHNYYLQKENDSPTQVHDMQS